MNNEALIPRKPRSDSVLKNLSQDQQDAIAHYSETKSLQATRDWIEQQYQVKTSRTAVCNFLAWTKMIHRRQANNGAVEGLVTPLESDAPMLSAEELHCAAQRHFAETVIADSNVSAFNQCQRIELRREELGIQRAELQLKRDIFERDSCEWIIKTYNDPKIRSLAQADDKAYAVKLGQLRKMMFGDS